MKCEIGVAVCLGLKVDWKGTGVGLEGAGNFCRQFRQFPFLPVYGKQVFVGYTVNGIIL